MTQTRIIRPDYRQQDAYQILLGGTMLQWVEEGLLVKVGTLREDIAEHDKCDIANIQGCHVRHDWALQKWGDIQTAQQNGYRQTDCTEDLMFLHGELGRLMDFLLQSRFLRTTADARSYYEIADAEAKLLAFKGEVVHREQAAQAPTGHMPKLTDEELARLDAEADAKKAAGADASLLGLDATPAEKKIKVVK